MSLPNFVKSDERDPFAKLKCDFEPKFNFWPLVAILNFEKNEKFFCRLVSRVILYVHAKFCPNRTNGIQMPGRNVICGVKIGQFWTFYRRPPSWILRKIKNSSVGLFLGSKTMSVLIFVQIGRTGSNNCQVKMWFSTTTPAAPSLCDKAVHRALLWEQKINNESSHQNQEKIFRQ